LTVGEGPGGCGFATAAPAIFSVKPTHADRKRGAPARCCGTGRSLRRTRARVEDYDTCSVVLPVMLGRPAWLTTIVTVQLPREIVRRSRIAIVALLLLILP
jgi:hypothetical protein